MLLLEPQSDVIEIGDFSKVENKIVATQLKWSPLPDLDHILVVDELRQLVLKGSENTNTQYKAL